MGRAFPRRAGAHRGAIGRARGHRHGGPERPTARGRSIAQLYAVEKEARGKSPEDRVTLRQAKAKPVFDALELWLQAQLHSIRPVAARFQAFLACQFHG
ncbi:IS66 family transposase, partial [Paracoccus jeotgali]|uniref:IS66 family transposase n=1 Tax=Paracoccus jeotgali TaxID=2065379 RepID=UPI0028B00DB1